ncbi:MULTISPECIES: DNA polymerase III subunit alpha [Exiguobacterium]|uniref:DNA-directed DNA polymerase n=1 Tax=Exiguobacterium antarcticum TaxID=132920 RepID=A0ABT6QXE9_9BACL|nr:MULTISPECIES: DNA polymerase III subunit alpha [Exiguobacterium]MCT4778847.1 DNA polymerase III subunit alpha [Exiguobacterium soli]MDI3233378.1 DNA polymerase III subunit alpha [Exiguobacterium antarcticum]
MIQLNVRTAYSPLQSTIRMDRYLDEVMQRGMPAVAICETALTGVPAFIAGCQQRALIPIIGFEQTVETEELTILWYAKTSRGLKTLYQIASQMPVEDCSDLIAILQPKRQAPEDEARLRRLIAQWIGLTQHATVYLGVKSVRSTVERDSREQYRQAAYALGIETIPIDPVRYLYREEAEAYQALRAIDEGTTLQEQKINRMAYFKSGEELHEQFSERELALVNQWGASQETLTLPFQSRPLPRVTENSDQTLKKLAYDGLLAHGRVDALATERLRYELEVIEKTGFADYFLIVEDLVRHAKTKGIRVGPGRGSAAGSLVSYALGITTVDPIKYGLLFERFLNPERVSMPDIDIDIEDERREEVLDYLVERYGRQHVGQIGTLSTLGAKAALRDVARVLEFSKDETDAAAKQLGKATTLQGLEQKAPLYRWFSGSEKRRQLLQLAQAIEGLPRQRSIHAAGVVIGSDELIETTPVDRNTSDRFVTQYLMKALEQQGLLKIDLLGLRNLTRLRQMEQLIQHTYPDFSVEQIPEEDKAALRLFSKGETDQIFQFESAGMKQTLREVKPSRFEDLVATMSLFRPGPMKFIDLYAKRKAGQPYQVVHPILEDVLQSTYGVIVYQEQIMEITRRVAGFTLAQADLLRRAISKKSSQSVEDEKKRFIEGALQNGFELTIAETLYDQIERFAGYGFNRSHAVAYTKISYALGYMKAHYPQIFSLVSIDQPERLVRVMREKRLPVFPPDIWISDYRSTLEGKGIRLGIQTLRGITEKDFQALREAAKSAQTITQLLTAVGWGKKERSKIELLLYSGALDRATHGDRGLSEQEILDYFTMASNTLLPDELASLGRRKTIANTNRTATDWARLERESLGFWLTYSPLMTAMKPQVETTHFQAISLESEHTNYLVCYIEQMREFKTKRAQTMAVIQAVDGYTTEEVVIFPKQYEAFKRSLYVGNVLLIEVKAQEREGNRQFVLERLRPLGQDVLFIKLQSKNELAVLERMLETMPGDIPVVVRYADTNETKALPGLYAVQQEEELLAQLRIRFGETNIILKNVPRSN